MKKHLILTLLIGFAFAFVSSVASADTGTPVHYVVKKEASKTISAADIAAEISGASALSTLTFVSPDVPQVPENYTSYYDAYRLNLPQHFLLPEKNPFIRDSKGRMCSLT